LLVGVLRDRHAADQLHDEVGAAAVVGAGVDHSRDVRVVHQREGLPLGLEAGDHLLGVHAQLDELQREFAADLVALFDAIDLAHPALAESFEDAVAANAFGRLLQQAAGAGDGAVTVGGGVVVTRFVRWGHGEAESAKWRTGLRGEG
jgi:hypothetical protein